MENSSLIAIFLTGLLTGGLSCMAVQGGLLAATIAQSEKDRIEKKLSMYNTTSPILSFLISKLVAYTLLGFLLGWLGSIFQLSITTQVILQVAVALFMIGTALNMLNVHPTFRYFILQPPKFVTRRIRQQSKSTHFFAPLLLGAFTVLIPCGVTQAMMALAIASGSPLYGALILFSFVLGTSPIFFILAYLATRLNNLFQERFMRFAALFIIVLAIYNLFNASSLLDIGSRGKIQKAQQVKASNSQNFKIIIGKNGYSPDKLVTQPNTHVNLIIENKAGFGCQQAFTIPSIGYQKIIPPGKSDTIAFTTPAGSTQIAFMCSMGMYKGVINVL